MQALQVIESINYLLDCHAGVAGSSPVPSIYIPLGEIHRLTNPSTIPLEIIEVQSGRYLSENDIVRFEDNYGRTEP